MESFPQKSAEQIAEIKKNAQAAIERNKDLVVGPDGVMLDGAVTPEIKAENTEAFLDRIN